MFRCFSKADCTFRLIKLYDLVRDTTSLPAPLFVFNKLTRISFPSFSVFQQMPCLSFTLVLDSLHLLLGPEAKVHSAAITGVYAAHPRRTFAPSLLLPIDRNLFGLLRLVQRQNAGKCHRGPATRLKKRLRGTSDVDINSEAKVDYRRSKSKNMCCSGAFRCSVIFLNCCYGQ